MKDKVVCNNHIEAEFWLDVFKLALELEDIPGISEAAKFADSALMQARERGATYQSN